VTSTSVELPRPALVRQNLLRRLPQTSINAPGSRPCTLALIRGRIVRQLIVSTVVDPRRSRAGRSTITEKDVNWSPLGRIRTWTCALRRPTRCTAFTGSIEEAVFDVTATHSNGLSPRPITNILAVDQGPRQNPPVDQYESRPVEIQDLGSDVHLIDTQMGGYEGITASYLIRGSKPCLIETGTALSAPVVIESLASLGVGAEDLATIVVTHIHLDHAGGVGDIARAYPNATVVVHERGARHLIDPARLVASARMVFGTQMDRLFGDLKPTEARRVVALGDIGSVDLGNGRQLRAFHNPGHASHHIGLVDSETGDLYTGDAAGVYVQQTAQVRPATPPPDFDLDLTLQSLQKMAEAEPTRLLFSHYGPVTTIDETLSASREELIYWVEGVRAARQTSSDLDHAVALVTERDRARNPVHYADEARVERFEALSSVAANVTGISRWLDTQDA
jgi:glyoxylase-like metal-dependent hydrolase (beta-lactamase superfamily II)